jgi:hypothetical protein
MAATKTERIINQLKPQIEEVVSNILNPVIEENHSVEIGWKKMQDTAVEAIIGLLLEHLPNSIITAPTTKSTYPDIKIENTEGVFAIDIKVNEDTKDPWFDMARIDTILKERINKFVEEWELVIKYRTSDGQFLKAYFNLFRETVGIRTECQGIKYRPYDGKVRPKSWADFDNNTIYWHTKKEFLEGVDRSRKHRWKENIKEHLIPYLSDNEKEEFKVLFDE